MRPPAELVRETVARALAEDLGWGDVTTDSIVPPDLAARGVVAARAAGVLCGVDILVEVYRQVDPAVDVEPAARDGDALRPGQTIARLSGPAASLLRGERVALNFVQRLSGVATAAARFVEAVRGTGARIVDTRKTTPGLRALEKYAVRAGGAGNHRFNLSDGVLIKDNHLAALADEPDPIATAVRRARAGAPHTLRVEVEVDTLEQLDRALAAGADVVLLDNMGPALLAEAVNRIAGNAVSEASGGVSLATVRAIAESGVDLISVGALTHSAPALDIGLDFAIGEPAAPARATGRGRA